MSSSSTRSSSDTLRPARANTARASASNPGSTASDPNLGSVTATRIVAVAPGSPAARSGLAPGDHLVRINGRVPRDIIQYRVLTDDADVSIDIDRGGLALNIDVDKRAGEPLGVEVESPLFDRVQT